ncbi:MAG: class I SAM-dependent methyltransferase [Alphaproteobacteria bacterium]|nr:class I SAM-dependent methyltransferase [Alphaproteobacteria bacterium]
MRITSLAALGATALACAAAVASPKTDWRAVLADSARPDADKARDADRRPAEVVAFAGVRPGAKIAELAPGGGYFTRILSGAVGPKGVVYAIARQETPALKAIADAKPNVKIAVSPPGTIAVPEPVDMVWTTLNYHDFKNVKVGDRDAAGIINAAAFKALKPGGTYFIVDHEAGKGVGATVTNTLHRIEGATVRQEVEAAGFRFEAESPLLRHAADDHSQRVIETGIRGKTDQFIYRFRKPK